MRIGSIVAATLLVEDLGTAVQAWPGARLGIMPRERALAIGALALAEAPCAVVGSARALTLVECRQPPGAGGWLEVRCDAEGAPTTASLECERPRAALAWYRGLGLVGEAVERADGAVKAVLPSGQALKLLPRSVLRPSAERPLLVSFSRIDANGRRIHGLVPRIMAGPGGELVELV